MLEAFSFMQSFTDCLFEYSNGKELQKYRTASIAHMLNLVLIKSEIRERNDEVQKKDGLEGTVNLSNVFELANALSDSEDEIKAPESKKEFDEKDLRD